MKHEIPFRVIVTNPLKDVLMKVQRGRGEFLDPGRVSSESMTFEFDITVDVSGVGLNFLGKYAQGPKDGRFVYVNSGKQAGQQNTIWDRRAKLSLMSITKEQIEAALSKPNSIIETTIDGVGRDGGPVCASVKGLVWKVLNK
ncbi:MAG: DUF5990 family protein [Pyrinomonadaceae bacterium]